MYIDIQNTLKQLTPWKKHSKYEKLGKDLKKTKNKKQKKIFSHVHSMY